eukprot:gene25042-31452_t
MLYYLFSYLDHAFDFPGAAAIYGKPIIRKLQMLQVGESIRDLGLTGQLEKKGTPTMG